MYNILICDDDRDIVNALKIYLTDSQYNILTAYTGQEALSLVENGNIHLLLLDIMMPEMDGITALKKIREFSNVPVILLTAKGEETDIIGGLNNGADDYITKPFRPMEVSARVRSVLRRYVSLGAAAPSPDVIEIGGVTLDDREKKVALDGDELPLTPTEYDILKLLMANKNKVFSPTEIYRRVWGEEPIGCENTVAVHIRHLREKLEIDPSAPRYLTVVWGKGYKFTAKTTEKSN